MDTTTDDAAIRADSDGLEEELSLGELTALALNADPNQPLGEDAVPYELGAWHSTRGLLPQWYMPALSSRIGRGWRAWVVLGVVATLLAIEASGLCSTFGQLVVG